MGREARCFGVWDGHSGEGKLLLETAELIFRGPFRLVIPFSRIKDLDASGDALQLTLDGKQVRFELGTASSAWAKAIREPKGRLQKLGVKAAQRVAIQGFDDAAFRSELEAVGAIVFRRFVGELDHLFFGVSSEDDLRRLGGLREKLKPAGALWILRPKGPAGVNERATMAAGKAVGLVDVKVVGFSSTHSAEKFVIPLAQRKT